MLDIKKEVEKIYPLAVEIRRHLHANPELSEHETETAKYISEILTEYGVRHTCGIAGNGIVAVIGEGERAAAVRADIDALPVTECTGLSCSSLRSGVMHACGHDMHTAILLTAGIILKSIESELTDANHAVKLFFQPAEETVGGAKRMIDEGCMQNPKVEGVIALHVDPANKSGTVALKYGPMNAQTQGFKLIVRGKSCHGAHPEGGIDAIVIASSIVNALQTIPSRFNAPTTPVVVTVGTFHAGEAGNIVSGEAVLTGTIRALKPDIMAANKTQFESVASGIASAWGGSAEVCWEDDFYPALINDDSVTALIEETAAELFGKEKIMIMKEPSLGADDFAFFTEAVKGSYFNLGTAVDGEPVYPLHNEHFAPCEEAMKTGIAVETAAVLKLLSSFHQKDRS